MYICPECGRSFPSAGFCTEDGGALQDAGADRLLGTTLGSYRVVSKIGEGGMGSVYKGLHPGIGSRVAIKVLSQDCAKSAGLVERFFAEARAVNLIRHENIVSVSDLSSLPDGRPYIVMELLEGAPVSGIIRAGGALPLGAAATLVGQLLDALSAAHEKGVIHRDLKPDNVFVTRSGRVKVLDFGIAKLRPELGGISDATRTGSLLGTPHYMSPEQAAGQRVDPRSDLYSAGVILFEVVTGQRPFAASSLYELLKAHVEHMPPAPSLLRRDVPPALEEVLLHALQKDPNYRYQTARDFREALQRASHALLADSFVSLPTIVAASLEKARVASSPVAAQSGAQPSAAALTPSSPQASRPLTPGPTPLSPGADRPPPTLRDGPIVEASLVGAAPLQEKKSSRLGYFAIGTCGVIVLASLGSCVTCAFIGSTVEQEQISVPLGNGEVAVYKPKQFDPVGFAARATAVASKRDASASLTGIRATGRWTDRALNMTDKAGDRTVYLYKTSSGCLAVEVGQTGLTTTERPNCPQRHVSPPSCSIEEVWDRIDDAGGPGGWLRGTLAYSAALDGTGSWRAKTKRFEGSVPDGCLGP